jgi:RNA polymerase sigma-70 factor (ECF subfamily)
MAAMEQLTDDEREAIALRYGADLTLQEVARAIGARTSTVEGRVYRGLAKLRAALRARAPSR